MLKIKKNYFIALVLMSLAACTTNSTKMVKVNPPFDHTFIKTVAVIEFSNSSSRTGAGKIIADRVEQLLLNESGYKILSRMDIDQILLEKNLDKVKGVISSSTAKEIGKLLNVDALIVGNVENYDIKYGNKAIEVTVATTFKVINTTDGRIIWSKTAYGKYLRPNKSIESEFECFAKAIESLMRDVRYLFPHEREELA